MHFYSTNAIIFGAATSQLEPKYFILDDQRAQRRVKAHRLNLHNKANFYANPQQMAEHIETLSSSNDTLAKRPLVIFTDGNMHAPEYEDTSTKRPQKQEYVATETGTLKALHDAHQKQQIGDYAVIIHSGNVGLGDYGNETDIDQLNTKDITINPKDKSQAIRIAKSIDELEPLTKALQLATRAVTN